MAGHSKWANIKHRKAAQDKKKARLATQCVREITLAVREGNTATPETNPRLRMAIQLAKSANITKEKIEQAIKKGGGEQKGALQMVRYAAMLQQGVACLLEAVTDNSNRTVAHIRSCLRKGGGHLIPTDSLSHLLIPKALFFIQPASVLNLDRQAIAWIGAGAEAIEEREEQLLIEAPVSAYKNLQALLLKQGVIVASAAVTYVPLQQITLSKEDREKVEAWLMQLMALEGVEKIYHNLATELIL